MALQITSFVNTTLSNNLGAAIDSNYMYITSAGNNGITRVNLINKEVKTYWATSIQGVGETYGIAISNGFLYGGRRNPDKTKIFKISISDPSGVNTNPNWAISSFTSSDTFQGGAHINSGYLYMCYYTTSGSPPKSHISRLNLSDPSNGYLPSWATGDSMYVMSMASYEGNLYLGNNKGEVHRLSLSGTNQTIFSPSTLYKSFTPTTTTVYGLAVHGTYLYGSLQSTNTIFRVNLLDNNVVNNSYANTGDLSITNSATGIATYGNDLYIVSYLNAVVSRAVLPNVIVTPLSTITFDTGNTYTVASGNVQVSIIDASNSTSNGIFYWYSTDGGNVYTQTTASPSGSAAITTRFYITGLPFGQKTIYVYAKNAIGNSAPVNTSVTVFTTPTAITNCSVSSIGSGNINVSITETSPPTNYNLNGVSYLYYLYTTGNNQSANTTAYTFGANLDSSYTTTFVLNNQPENNYRVYLIAKNSVGNTVANAFSANVAVYVFTPPINSITFDTGNTRTVASGNLKVSIFDPSNTLTNNVYYEYSLNGSVYINTNVNAGPSPNNLYILSSDISNTILVRAKNSLGNSTPISLQTVIYQKPTVAPSSVTLSLISSGNVQVTVSESNPVPYYYLNNVSYVCYPYLNSGTNLSNNISAYTSNVGILANTNTTYIPVASYVSGLSANTYTFYVKAQNQFGNTETTTISENISVYTLPNPPVIDPSNTLSKTSGNLTVAITDGLNSSTNGLYYLYSTDGITYGNSGVAKTTSTSYQFVINNTGNAQIPLVANAYTLYIRASNPVGNATSTLSSVNVYTTPFSPTIDPTNTKSTTSGNLTVAITDGLNSSTNGLYYLYSTDGITYGNSEVAKTSAATTYQFNINNTGNAQIPLVANTYTLYVRVSNPVGNATSTLSSVSVYTTPIAPVIDTTNTKSTTSGNLTVTITDSNNSSTNGLYYLYSTDGITYGNSGLTKTSASTTYQFNINNTGNAQIPLVANAYTLYVRVSNPVGNATSTSIQPFNVYTTPLPPNIDPGNTKPISSGSVTVAFTDNVNTPNNAIEYTYFVYDSAVAPILYL